MTTLKVKLVYPLSPFKIIEFKGMNSDYFYESIKNEKWFKCEVLECDISKFNRLYRKILIYNLKEMLKYKHTHSKCNTIEELICQLEC